MRRIMIDLIDVIENCKRLDRNVLVKPDDDPDLRELLVKEHLVLADLLEQMSEDEFDELDLSNEDRQQILSEKQLLNVFGSKGEYETVNFLTTFTCFLLSRQNGEGMHSRKYMDDVKEIHRAVNLYYGKDPDAARSCS